MTTGLSEGRDAEKSTPARPGYSTRPCLTDAPTVPGRVDVLASDRGGELSVPLISWVICHYSGTVVGTEVGWIAPRSGPVSDIGLIWDSPSATATASDRPPSPEPDRPAERGGAPVACATPSGAGVERLHGSEA